MRPSQPDIRHGIVLAPRIERAHVTAREVVGFRAVAMSDGRLVFHGAAHMPSDLLLAAVLDGVRELYDGAACPLTRTYN